jgi:hypothetical protein
MHPRKKHEQQLNIENWLCKAVDEIDNNKLLTILVAICPSKNTLHHFWMQRMAGLKELN